MERGHVWCLSKRLSGSDRMKKMQSTDIIEMGGRYMIFGSVIFFCVSLVFFGRPTEASLLGSLSLLSFRSGKSRSCSNKSHGAWVSAFFLEGIAEGWWAATRLDRCFAPAVQRSRLSFLSLLSSSRDAHTRAHADTYTRTRAIVWRHQVCIVSVAALYITPSAENWLLCCSILYNPTTVAVLLALSLRSFRNPPPTRHGNPRAYPLKVRLIHLTRQHEAAGGGAAVVLAAQVEGPPQRHDVACWYVICMG